MLLKYLKWRNQILAELCYWKECKQGSLELHTQNQGNLCKKQISRVSLQRSSRD